MGEEGLSRPRMCSVDMWHMALNHGEVPGQTGTVGAHHYGGHEDRAQTGWTMSCCCCCCCSPAASN